MKGPVHQGDRTIANACLPNSSLEMQEANTHRTEGKCNSTAVVRCSNAPLPTTERRAGGKKINKNLDDLNNTIYHRGTVDVYQTLGPTKKNTCFFPKGTRSVYQDRQYSGL